MATVTTLVTIKHGGVYYPPGSTIFDFDDVEARALRGRVEVVEGEEAELPAEPEATEDDEVPPVPPVASAPDAAADDDRVSVVALTMDLLDEATDFEADGSPKIDVLASVLGFKPTVDEVAAAIALRAEGL
ncbi:hypothetical protein [Methylobacterium sp. WCS2018Hpa-22]|uniref:hypothetical protein n=1 Tax=Methylobacterium sp. WCS2018Hpa-22 TaxID=3073633 RepID=UPI00288B8DD7|nr:hypothetical protein [Methylobacterium sp. WCS2018Hpa-22]